MGEITDAGINWILISVPNLSFNTSGDNHNTVITTSFFFTCFRVFVLSCVINQAQCFHLSLKAKTRS